MNGKLIRLFLVDGKANGLRTVEISNMTIHGTIFPRNQLDKFATRDAATKPGVYLIVGPDVNEPDQFLLYIGEGDPVLPRLKDHSSKKDFWTEAIVFSSKDDYLTKTQIKYLEAELCAIAKDSFKVKLDNSQTPTKPNISEVDKAEVSQFLEAIKLILSAVGIDILEPRKVTSNVNELDNIFEFATKNAFAKMAIIDNKYVVLKGSTALLDNRPSSSESLIKMRQDLITRGIMINKGDGVFTFIEDAQFNSPSYAAAAIVGGNVNGRISWKIGSKTLKQYEAELLGALSTDNED